LQIFGTGNPHFNSHNSEVFREGANMGLPPPRQFCKNCSRGLAP